MSCERSGTKEAVVEDPKGSAIEVPAIVPVAGKAPAPYFDRAVDWQAGKINIVYPIRRPVLLSD